jgi:hypothetical protein
MRGTIKASKGVNAREAALRWAEKHLPVTFETIAGTVLIDRRSVADSLSKGSGQEKLDAISAFPDAFQNAVYLGTASDFDGQPIENHYFVFPIQYDGKRQLVFCRARQDVNKNRLYVHEVFTEGEIKEGSLQTHAALSGRPTAEPLRGTNLYRSILKNIYAVNSKEVSKIVDENGEPLVVYHSTGENFHVFDIEKSRSYKGQPDYDLPGFYFSTNKDLSADYGDNTITAFLNIRHPFKADDLIAYKRDNKIATWREVYERLRKEGFDGAITEKEGVNNVEDELIAFNPSQIKSATDNNGDFSENPSILYSARSHFPQGATLRGKIYEGDIPNDDTDADSENDNVIKRRFLEHNVSGVVGNRHEFIGISNNTNAAATKAPRGAERTTGGSKTRSVEKNPSRGENAHPKQVGVSGADARRDAIPQQGNPRQNGTAPSDMVARQGNRQRGDTATGHMGSPPTPPPETHASNGVRYVPLVTAIVKGMVPAGTDPAPYLSRAKRLLAKVWRMAKTAQTTDPTAPAPDYTATKGTDPFSLDLRLDL